MQSHYPYEAYIPMEEIQINSFINSCLKELKVEHPE